MTLLGFGLATAAAAVGDPAAMAAEWGGALATGAGGTTAAVALYYALQARIADMRAELRGELDDVERAVDAVAKRLGDVADTLTSVRERLSRIEGAMDVERDRHREQARGTG